jgi:hypothetical protein
MQTATHSYFVRGFFFVPRIDDTRGILADEHNIQARWTSKFGHKPRDFRTHFVPNLLS